MSETGASLTDAPSAAGAVAAAPLADSALAAPVAPAVAANPPRKCNRKETAEA